MPEPWPLIILVLAGIAAGFINTLAGGGSLLTLPALMLLGLPADVANGTNRLSVLAQSLSGAWAFHREDKLDTGRIGPALLPTVLGSLIGALAASMAPPWLLKPVMLGIMIVVAVLMAVVNLSAPGEDTQPKELGVAGWLGLFGAGVYGGFIQAGVGFILLAVLAMLLRYDIVRANAMKLVCTSLFGIVGLVVFVAAGQMRWLPAAALAAATVTGSQLGVRFALKVDGRLMRWIVVGCVVASSAAVWLRT